MSDKPPAFQFYANDFIGATSSWSNEEVGIYMRLLCHQWVNGHIPSDEKRIARIVSMSIDEFREAWSVVGDKFQAAGKDKLRNKRLEEVRKKQLEYREEMRKRGKKGASNRWQRDSNSKVVQFEGGGKNNE